MADTIQSQPLDMIIASEAVKAEGGRTFTRFDPISGAPATQAAAGSGASSAAATDQQAASRHAASR